MQSIAPAGKSREKARLSGGPFAFLYYQPRTIAQP
jgi:hypothetical protein